MARTQIYLARVAVRFGFVPIYWLCWNMLCITQCTRRARCLSEHLQSNVCMQLDMYYNGFCNSVLWQLFHYVPLNIDSWQKMSEHRAMQMQWQAYQVGGILVCALISPYRMFRHPAGVHFKSPHSATAWLTLKALLPSCRLQIKSLQTLCWRTTCPTTSCGSRTIT